MSSLAPAPAPGVRRSLRRAAVLAAALAAGAAAHGHGGSIHVDDAWSRELPPVSRNGAAYLSVRNAGATADALVGADTPVAARAEVHEHVMHGGVMRMQPVDALSLPPGETVRMAPGGLHLMLFDLKAPLRRGERFPVTLRFRDAPALEVQVEVRGPGGEPAHAAPAHDGHRHGAGHGTR